MQWVAARHILIDIIYNPAETPFLKAGKEKGAKTINGYGMLVYQAAEAFRIWTGIEPPIEVMWAAGLLELQNMR
jgi:shikimate dehydrogenase